MLAPCPPHQHTASKATTGTLLPTASPSGQHTGRGRQHTHRDTSRRRFVASKGERGTDPQTPDLLREAGIQLKARHNFLTLLAHKSKYSTYTTTQTWQERVLRGERGRRSHPQGDRAGWRPLTLLTGLQLLPLSGLSPHSHSLPPGPAGRRQKLFADNSPPFPCVAPPAAS